jgi:hypothetical protein
MGVQLVPGPKGCCSAVKALALQRFLVNEAPLFPLKDCDFESCDCRYRRIVDRRTAVRRDVDLGLGAMTRLVQTTGNCRRSDERGRRALDKEE